MGQFTFLLPAELSPEARRCLDRACMAGGYDLSPSPSHPNINDDRLVLTRDVSESGYLLAPWPVAGFGVPACLSATLREREEPYYLAIELARGKLNQVRNQIAEWEMAGMVLSPTDRADLKTAIHTFGQAVLEPADPAAAGLAAEALATAARLGDHLTGVFTELLMQHRIGDSGQPNTLVGARLYQPPAGNDEEAAYQAAFNAVRVVPNWATLEPTETQFNWDTLDATVNWATSAGMDVSIGPLIDLAHGPFPAWLQAWNGDLPSLAAFMCDFVETVVTRYKDRVSSWHVFAGFNHATLFELSEDDQLRLAARLLEAVKQSASANAMLTVGLAFPWGEYLTSEELTYSPLVFADTLLRGGLQVNGLELELFFGDGPRSSTPRTVLDTYRVLDLFALLGIPLELAIAMPPNAADIPPGWLAGTAFLAMSVSQVRSIYWDNWSSSDPTRLPGAALWNGTGPVGDALSVLGNLRRQWGR